MSFKENLDALSNFMGKIGVFEVAIFVGVFSVLFGATWVIVDKVIFPDIDLSLGMVIQEIKSAFDIGAANG